MCHHDRISRRRTFLIARLPRSCRLRQPLRVYASLDTTTLARCLTAFTGVGVCQRASALFAPCRLLRCASLPSLPTPPLLAGLLFYSSQPLQPLPLVMLPCLPLVHPSHSFVIPRCLSSFCPSQMPKATTETRKHKTLQPPMQDKDNSNNAAPSAPRPAARLWGLSPGAGDCSGSDGGGGGEDG
ncbi:hypothetical protein C8J57DRAFT_1731683 [Mycena rebaudengoi]|nr:hypothetical protein C8J57DRAFT_1731683 [Mycena rebaudengoi]